MKRYEEPAAWRRGLFCLALVMFFSGSAQAAVRVSVFGVGTSSDLKYFSDSGSSLDGPVDSQLGYGGGLSLEIPWGSRVGLELGAIYLARRVRDTTVTPSLVFQSTSLQVPVQLRLRLFRSLLLGAGGYVAHALGTIRDDLGGSTTYSDAGYRKLDYGLVGSVGISLFGPIFVEGRYIHGLADQIDHGVADPLAPSLASQRARWREIQLLLGLRFGGPK